MDHSICLYSIMNTANFLKPTITSKVPRKKALIIGYDHKDIIQHMDAYGERYQREFDVEKIFINSKDIKDIGLSKGTGIASPSSQELINKLAWVQSSGNSLISFIHHAGKTTTLKKHEGKMTGKVLSRHGLNSSDLRKMRIRYEPCYGANKEAQDFFNALHEGGAGNFVGDAKTVANSASLDNTQQLSREHIEQKKHSLASEIYSFENLDIDYSKKNPVYKNSGIKVENELLKNYKSNKDYLVRLNESDLFTNSLKRGDSFVGIELAEHPNVKKIAKLPRSIDAETGDYLYNHFYLAPIKTETSRVEMSKSPDRIHEFLMQNTNRNNTEKSNKNSKNRNKI